MWLWIEKINKMLSQKSGSNLMCKSTSMLFLKSWLF